MAKPIHHPIVTAPDGDLRYYLLNRGEGRHGALISLKWGGNAIVGKACVLLAPSYLDRLAKRTKPETDQS